MLNKQETQAAVPVRDQIRLLHFFANPRSRATSQCGGSKSLGCTKKSTSDMPASRRRRSGTGTATDELDMHPQNASLLKALWVTPPSLLLCRFFDRHAEYVHAPS